MERKPTFSIFLPQAAMPYSMIRDRACLAESLGYEGVWLVDHMWGKGLPDADFLEGWSTLAALAQATERLRLGTLVSCNSYRNPGLLAKIVATVDQISEGRAELGIGAGWMEEEYLAYGYEFPPIRTRLAQLEEALEVITRLFHEQRTTVEGKYYKFRDVPFAPKPLQSPLPITVGGSGKRVLMRLVARYAARWNCPMTAAAELSAHREALAEHCRRLGRRVEEIIISEQTAVVIGRNEEDYRTKRMLAKTMIGGFVDLGRMAVCGTPEQVVSGLEEKMHRGVTDFAVLFGDLGMPKTLELFAETVIPALVTATAGGA